MIYIFITNMKSNTHCDIGFYPRTHLFYFRNQILRVLIDYSHHGIMLDLIHYSTIIYFPNQNINNFSYS